MKASIVLKNGTIRNVVCSRKTIEMKENKSDLCCSNRQLLLSRNILYLSK